MWKCYHSVDYCIPAPSRTPSFPMRLNTILPLVCLLLVFLDCNVLMGAKSKPPSAPSVTFSATGLPPGMIINSSTGNISGTPTQPGIYSVVISPMFGTFVGNMSLVNINIFPQSVKLPKYFAYNRVLPSGGSISWSGGLAGGGGYILGEYQSNNSNIPVFTTDGVHFSTPSTPPQTTFFYVNGNYSSGYPPVSTASIAGSTAMVLGLDSQGNQALFTSSGMGAFYQNSNPNDSAFNSGVGSVISSDGNSTFYCAIEDYSGNINLWKSSNNPINWSLAGRFSSTSYGAPMGISVARNGQNIVIAVEQEGWYWGKGGPQGILLYSTDGGVSFYKNTSNSDIVSVAFGNNAYLGSGLNGVWSSVDGITWSQISTISVGQLIYSSPERLFFSSQAGVSTNGQYWLSGNNSLKNYFDTPIVSSGNGVIYLGNQQLSTSKITYASSGRFNAVAGTSTNITCTFSGSGDFTY